MATKPKCFDKVIRHHCGDITRIYTYPTSVYDNTLEIHGHMGGALYVPLNEAIRIENALIEGANWLKERLAKLGCEED